MKCRIIIGDVRQRICDLPDESVHCVVTSPPYFGLRDYGNAGQIGLEATPDAYIAELVAVFRDAWRALRSDGTFWLVIGDSYSSGNGVKTNRPQTNITSVNGVDVRMPRAATPSDARASLSRTFAGMPAAKQRLMIPARVALALQADGWWLRDEIIWHKPNPMPISANDRTTPAHEMLYMFSKSARYYYDMEKLLEPLSEWSKKALISNWTRKTRNACPDRNDNNDGVGSSYASKVNPAGRQPRSVWSVPTHSFKGAHFATFPPDLIRPCILAGCPEGGTVLDPFFGAGTTGLVAQQLNRNSIGIELNPEYADMARRRVDGFAPLFAEAAE